MGITEGKKAELVLNIVIGIEFSYVFVWALINQKNSIIILSSFLASFGILRTVGWLWLFKYSAKKHDDEYIEFIDENARLIGAITGIFILAQLAVLEVITGIVISIMSAFVIVFITFIIAYIVTAAIPLNIDSGDEN